MSEMSHESSGDLFHSFQQVQAKSSRALAHVLTACIMLSSPAMPVLTCAGVSQTYQLWQLELGRVNMPSEILQCPEESTNRPCLCF